MAQHPFITFIINFLDAAIILGGIPNFLYNKSGLEGFAYKCFLLTLILRYLIAPVVPMIIQKIGCRVLIVLTGFLASVLLFIKPFFPQNGFAEIMIFVAGIVLAFPAFCSDINAVQRSTSKTNLGVPLALSGKVLGIFISTESQRFIEGLSFGFADSENLFFMYAGMCFIITLYGAAFIWSPDAPTETQSDSNQCELEKSVMPRLRCINFLVYMFYFPDGMNQLYLGNSPNMLPLMVVGMYWIFFIAAAILPIYIGLMYNRKQPVKALTVFCWSFPMAWVAVIGVPIVIAVFLGILLTIFQGEFTIIEYFLYVYAKLVGSAGLGFFMLVTGCELVTLVVLSQMVTSTSKLFMEKYANLWVARGGGLFICLVVFGGVPSLYRLLFLPDFSVRQDSDTANYTRFLLAWAIFNTILEILATIKIVQVVRQMIVDEKKRMEENLQNVMELVADG